MHRFLQVVVHSVVVVFHRVVESNRIDFEMSKDKTSKPQEDEEKYDPEIAMERMNSALRGARIAGPKPLKEKPKIRRKRGPSASA